MMETGQGDLITLQKKIKTLEYQLDQIKQKNNAAIAGNKILRAKIDGLRKERSMFDQIYKQLETELCRKKNELLKIIVEADKIRQQRQDAHQRLLDLKEKAQKEQRQFEVEYQNVFELLEIEQQEKAQLKHAADLERHRVEDELRRSREQAIESKSTNKVLHTSAHSSRKRQKVNDIQICEYTNRQISSSCERYIIFGNDVKYGCSSFLFHVPLCSFSWADSGRRILRGFFPLTCHANFRCARSLGSLFDLC